MSLTKRSAQEHKNIAPAQALQTSFYLSDKLHAVHGLNHHTVAFNLTRKPDENVPLDIEKMIRVLFILLNRHEALRCRFQEIDGILHQLFLPADQFKQTPIWPLQELDAQSATMVSPDKILETFQLLKQDQLLFEPLNLEKPPLWKCILLRFQEQFQLVFIFHHAIVDGLSEEIFFEEFSALYHDPQKKLAPIKPISELSQLSEAQVEQNLDFWRSRSRRCPPLAFQTDLTPQSTFRYRGDRVPFQFNPDFKQLDQVIAAKSISSQPDGKDQITKKGVKINSFLMAVETAHDYRYTREPKICISTVSGNRKHDPARKPLINCFANTVPILTDGISDDMSFAELYEKVESASKTYYEHQLPVDMLSRKTKAGSALKCLVLAQPAKKSFKLDGFEPTVPVEPNLGLTRCEYYGIKAHGADAYFEFNRELMTRTYAERKVEQFCRIMKAVCENPAIKISELPLVTDTEKKFIQQINSKERKVGPEFIHQLLSKRATQNPKAVAWSFHPSIETEPVTYTYQQADETSHQLAAFLQTQYQIGIDTLVGLSVTRSLNLLTAVMSVFKSGATLVPLESSQQKKTAIFNKIRASNTNFILVDNATKKIFESQVEEDELTLINVDEILPRLTQEQLKLKEAKLNPDHIAYITFTSGTTGEPKGILTTHGNLRHCMTGILDRNPKEGANVYWAAGITWDASFFEIAVHLMANGTLHFYPEELRASPQAIEHVMLRDNIDFATLTPHALDSINPALLPKRKRYIISMGSALSDKTREKWHQAGNPLSDEYGPAEATCDSTVHANPSLDQPTGCIGFPKSNTPIYILDEAYNVCPLYVPGIMYIGGDGLSPGYLNNDALTKERFVELFEDSDQCRFLKTPPKPDAKKIRLYKTGDLAILTPHGIVFQGRLDRQIKVLGVLISVDGMEAAILRCIPEVKEVTVVQLNKRLICYYVPTERNKKVEAQYINRKLKKTPLSTVAVLHASVLVPEESLPRNANTKVDVDKLVQTYKIDSSDIKQPSTDIQKKLRSIWADVLANVAHLEIKESDIGINQTFEMLGGYSSIFPDITLKISDKFQTKFSMEELFPVPNSEAEKIGASDITIEEQSTLLQQLLDSKRAELAKAAAQQQPAAAQIQIAPGSLTQHSHFQPAPLNTKNNAPDNILGSTP